jgi:hypothetical protein
VSAIAAGTSRCYARCVLLKAVVVGVISVVSLASRDAHACTALPGSDGCERWARASMGPFLAMVGGIVALPSLATPIAIAVYGARGNGVPLELSVTSTMLWAAHTALATASLVIPPANGPFAPAWELSIPYFAVSGAMLGVSIWSLTTPPIAPPSRLVFAPQWGAGGAGVVVGGVL